MNAKETFYLIATLASLSVILIPIVSDIWEPFKKSPVLVASLDPPRNPNNMHTELRVENVGDIEARNAYVYIQAKELLHVKDEFCPEGQIIISEDKGADTIYFEKISTNLPCIVNFDNSTKGLIFNIAVTADGISATNYKKDNINLQEVQELKLVITSEPFSKSKVFFDLLAFAIISSMIATFLLKFALTRIKNQEEINKEKQIQESLKEREEEINSEINRLEDELDFIDNAINTQPEREVPEHTIKRRDWILERITTLNNERDKIRGSILTKREVHQSIGEFFEKWSEIEHHITTINSKISNKRIRYPNILQFLKELRRRELLTDTTYNELQSLRRFRNELVHGRIKLSSEEISERIPKLNELTELLKNIIIPIQYVVHIPKGSSKPGCEEMDRCFIPSRLVIRQNETVTWENDDNTSHTITSGLPEDGPDGKFDSSMMMGGTSFYVTLKEKGEYPYFCMLHPWQIGKVTVQ